MTRKRRSGISEAEAVLGGVIHILEQDDRPLGNPDPQVVLRLLRAYHGALRDLLTHGPLLCDEAIAREAGRSEQPPIRPDDAGVIRLELLQLLRSAVRFGPIGASSSRIFLSPPPRQMLSFAVRLVDGRASIAATGDTRSLVILQTLLLLHEVGLANVRECSAPDCQRLFVKVYRKEFCSAQCQKRINTRKQRQTARDQKERLARRRRQRRKKGA